MADSPSFDTPAYLVRIRYNGALTPTLSTLEALHVRHVDRIPFENISVFLGDRVDLDPEMLQAKLVHDRRGGYCFEHNALFACALRALGFEVETLEARVRPPGTRALLPRTHMLLRVVIGGRAFLADVGFGGDGPLFPVPLDGGVGQQPDGAYRVDREKDGVHVLRCLRGREWRDLYAFTLMPAHPVDFEVAHYFTSTHPQSVFVRTLTVQRSELVARHILRGLTYAIRMRDQERVREIPFPELGPLLTQRFGLDLSDEDLRRILCKMERGERWQN